MAAEADRIPLPWSHSCFVCGDQNPHGLRARSWIVGDTIELPLRIPPESVGWQGVTHGGILATVLDEVMTWAAIVAREQPCFAAEFTVRLKRPLRPGSRCVVRGRCERLRRRVIDAAAEIVDEAGSVFATANGRYMAMPRDHRDAVRHDFVSVEGCWPVEKILAEPTPEDP